MTRSRSKLHFNKLEEFKAYLIEHGWVEAPHRADQYEVLKMWHQKEGAPIILHKRLNATQHVTTSGIGDRMADSFLNSRKHSRQRCID